MQEIFKDIPGYEGLYQVSNIGNVKSIIYKKERILIPRINNKGYYQILLARNGVNTTKTIHQLVAIAFLNHTTDNRKIVVDHIDNVKLNNNLNNLQVITNRENCSKDIKLGTSKYIGVTWHKPSKRWRAQIRINGIKKHIGMFDDELEASIAYKNIVKNL